MQDIILNQVLQFSFPETFRVMSEEEVAQLNVIGRGEGVCLKSEELHIVISMGWKQEGGFFTKLLVGKDLVAPMESYYRNRICCLHFQG